MNVPHLPVDATPADALRFMRELTKAIGPGFHPDTPAADYVSAQSDVVLFTNDQALRIDADIDRAFCLLESAERDPYQIAHRVQRRLLGLPILTCE
jgi:hypothetical protein